MNFLNKVSVLFFVINVVLLIFISYWISYHPQKTETELTKKPTQTVTSTVANTTKVSYVPKEKGENTDVEITSKKPNVVVSVNGKKQELPLISNEKRKFENGKVVVEQETKVVLDVKEPKKNELQFYAQTGGNKRNISYSVGVEKHNGNLVYGINYSPIDKEKNIYVRYNIASFNSK